MVNAVMKTRYYSFLLRLWASEMGDSTIWRVSLESAKTGEKTVFTNLEELSAFLKDLTTADLVRRGNANTE